MSAPSRRVPAPTPRLSSGKGVSARAHARRLQPGVAQPTQARGGVPHPRQFPGRRGVTFPPSPFPLGRPGWGSGSGLGGTSGAHLRPGEAPGPTLGRCAREGARSRSQELTDTHHAHTNKAGHKKLKGLALEMRPKKVPEGVSVRTRLQSGCVSKLRVTPGEEALSCPSPWS